MSLLVLEVVMVLDVGRSHGEAKSHVMTAVFAWWKWLAVDARDLVIVVSGVRVVKNVINPRSLYLLAGFKCISNAGSHYSSLF